MSMRLQDSLEGADLAQAGEGLTAGLSLDRRAIVFLFLCASLCQVPLYAFINFIAGSAAAAVTVLFSIVPLTFFHQLSKHIRSPGVEGNLILATGFVLFSINSSLTGGLTSPVLIWSMMVPAIATLMCGRRSGLVWSALVTFQISIFFWSEDWADQFPQRYSSSGYSLAFFASMTGIMLLALFLALVMEYYRIRYHQKIEAKNKKLQEAIAKLRALQNLLPICAWCKKIRDDQGYWEEIEGYFEAHSKLEFSRSLCDTCLPAS